MSFKEIIYKIAPWLVNKCSDGTYLWKWEGNCPDTTTTTTELPTTTTTTTPHGNFSGFIVGSEETCGNIDGTRPSIAIDKNNNIYCIFDRGTSNTIYLAYKWKGSWKSREFAVGEKNGDYDAARLYMPHIEIVNDRAWISTKFGCKEWGSMLGQGLWIVDNLASNKDFEPSKFVWVKSSDLHKGNANVVTSDSEPDYCYMIGTNGLFAKFSHNGDLINKGQIKIGNSGEKIRALSTRSGIKHLAMGGYSADSSSYQNTKRNASPVVWAAYATYPNQGSDMEHPGIGIDTSNENVSYISACYRGVTINIWNGQHMVFPSTDLKIIDSNGNMGGVDRFGPQWSPRIGGGSYLTWVNSKKIKMTLVNSDGTSSQNFDICQGTSPSIATDNEGNIHLMYSNNGIKYRKITPK